MTTTYSGALPRFYGPDQDFPGWERHYKRVDGHPCIHVLDGEAIVPEGAAAHMDTYHDALSPWHRETFPQATRLRLRRRGDIHQTAIVETDE